MRLSADINCFYGLYSIEETIDILTEAGFDAIDFTFMDERYYNGEVSEEECKRRYTRIKHYAESKGVCFNQAHAPCPSAKVDEAETERLFFHIVRSMRNASYLGIETIVVHGKDHMEYASEGGAERLYELNMEFYNRLKPYCEEYGIRIAIENLPQIHKFIFGEKVVNSVCSTPEELIRYLDTLNSECFVACLDIGHAMITGQNPEKFIRKLGKERLKALHVHDNNGVRDMHVLPYLGGMADWDRITKALKEIDYSGDFTFEAGNFLKPLPKELYPVGAKMMAATGRYLINRINSWENE